MSAIAVKRRLDYKAPEFFIDKTELFFELAPEATKVRSILHVRRAEQSCDTIKLDGEGLRLLSVTLDQRRLVAETDYSLNQHELSIPVKNDHFILEIENEINPKANTTLEGLYYMQSTYCTQCEAEGFRKICYFLDRPDVLSIYTVTITAALDDCPYLLSNGNLINETVNAGVKTVTWQDPHPKPSYLFALVAGDFDLLQTDYRSADDRDIKLQLFVEKGRKHQGEFALESLKKAMQWDEQKYGLYYDLDIYMVVAVDFFNMGAMENKGLNVFNSKFVLADPSTASDSDYFNIESIIAHEYFHNWTGNRVTCRDWFQLSLKEGLTVFRDQQFSADMSSYLGTRISQVRVIREHQFAEDAGPMSHPIRPDEVMEMNNFYTVTVYDKGAEVIRMLHTLLGESGFRAGMDLYFARHDGQAVTCDDFVQAMQDANQIDLNHFRLWYAQSGTPQINITKSKVDNKTIFHFQQLTPKTADQAHKQALYVPIKTQLLAKNGGAVPIDEYDNSVIVLDQREMEIVIEAQDIVPVFLDEFSAPVKINYAQSVKEKLHIIEFSGSDYARWDASQSIYQVWIHALYHGQFGPQMEDEITAFASLLSSKPFSDDVLAEMLSLPGFETLVDQLDSLQPTAMYRAKEQLYHKLAQALGDFSLSRLAELSPEPYQYTQTQVHRRSLYCVHLGLACANVQTKASALNILENVYQDADNMTDKLNCLKVAQQSSIPLFDKLMVDFEQTYRHDAVVMDKWFAMHASTERKDILARLDLLMAHSQFNLQNPNKVRSLVGSFAFYNIPGLHAEDGSGYKFICDKLIEIDKINPQVASRIVTPMLSMARYAQTPRLLMFKQMSRLLNSKHLSKDLFEKVSKALTNLKV